MAYKEDKEDLSKDSIKFLLIFTRIIILYKIAQRKGKVMMYEKG